MAAQTQLWFDLTCHSRLSLQCDRLRSCYAVQACTILESSSMLLSASPLLEQYLESATTELAAATRPQNGGARSNAWSHGTCHLCNLLVFLNCVPFLCSCSCGNAATNSIKRQQWCSRRGRVISCNIFFSRHAFGHAVCFLEQPQIRSTDLQQLCCRQGRCISCNIFSTRHAFGNAAYLLEACKRHRGAPPCVGSACIGSLASSGRPSRVNESVLLYPPPPH